MWAHYGENHRGVALAFHRDKILKAAIAAVDTNTELHFGHVLYVSPDHPAEVHPVIIDYRHWLSRPPKESAHRHLVQHRGWFFFTKHNAWAAEQECRLVAFGELDRYEHIPFGDALAEIIIGEAATAHTVAACEHFGKKLGVPVSRVFWRNGLASRVPPNDE